MNKFCDNPECRMHIDVPHDTGGYDVEEDGKVKRILRHPYWTGKISDGQYLNFCTTCHKAIELWMKQ